MTTPAAPTPPSTFLQGTRVLELADELGEYCGRLLAGLGAEVVKIEPPGGEGTRRHGPFHHDEPHPDRSLHFWHYNLGKRSVVLDLTTEAGRRGFRDLAAGADVLLDTRHRDYLRSAGLDPDDLVAANPGLIHARISPFGDDGPWADHVGSDLVHLALGGVMMNCGYSPDPYGVYDTPPIAPQMWQAYHMAGELAAIGIMTALIHRLSHGAGQRLSTAVHEVVSKNTEVDLPSWVYSRQPLMRQTCQHAAAQVGDPALAVTKDGRYLLPWRLMGAAGFVDAWAGSLRLLKRYDSAEDLADARYDDPALRQDPQVKRHIGRVVDALSSKLTYERGLWAEAQEEGLPWGPLRRPEENVADAHWRSRETFIDVHHPELGETYTYVGAKWLAPEVPWTRGPRPPLVGEHTDEILADAARRVPRPIHAAAVPRPAFAAPSALGTPFALSGVRVVDLTWQLASAGAGRYLTSMGAEVIKVEHSSRWDGMRWAAVGRPPAGGRAERDAATGPLPVPDADSPNRCGSFMEINSGKRAMSLNLKSDRGKEILAKLLADADMVIEGFTPGTMDRMGFGYDRLKEINPRIVYVQQSGMGQFGTYGQMRSYGPIAQAFSGLSEMSGLPAPYPPAGIGYSYLDWFGAYNMATAMMAALYRQRTTGLGCHIDSSQVETGTYLTGTAVLDHSVNGRGWTRYGNRSPYKPAAPHGVFPTRGEDRWIAIACFGDEQWRGLVEVLGAPHWAADPRFATLEGRIAAQDELERHLADETTGWGGYALMSALQSVGVPAGVCQTAQDRCDTDPQLAHLGWLVELGQSELGRWPVKEHPVKFSETPAYMGGPVDRSGPNYAEDNAYVFRDLLGFTAEEYLTLIDEGVTEESWKAS
ncbi:CaiB/BaiF CoA transferase family protein [Pseudonocardia sp. RS010]|uniref:CaiB/BaiF CoA transferase family protein n=1 Tax=Pseudonocardia sp. RS010 TaxID=3385979 RepID=UPI0039A1EE71